MSKKLRAIVVDDEELARAYLTELLIVHSDVEVVATCANGFEAVKACFRHTPDLVFLDIQMPKLTGFEVVELIDPGIRVVFVTAYDEYALKAFEVHAVDYLLKPFSAERLSEALALVRTRPAPDSSGRLLAAAARPKADHLERIAVKDGSSVEVIPVGDLDYAQAQDDYVELHTKGRSFLKHQTLASLENDLDPEQFVRIHRSTLVNLERIERIEPWTKDTKLAILIDGTQLNVSRSGYTRLRKFFDGTDRSGK